ncbi:MAG: tRNA-dihydrouridine synthase family protein [Muribaculaceae bacterium]|nr:tRNA-dihydrouridine synthase family protein [Muribaculaceae bacterium]
MKILFAPIQGHTDAAYRHFHSEIYGVQLPYYTPFIRLEKGSIRPRDLKDIKSELNDNHTIIPQIIFRDRKELFTLVELLVKEGIKEIDLNMGCPFPLQTGHGRGAATISNSEVAKAVEDVVKSYPDITFSVKMRLGMENPEEWKSLLPSLNKINLRHIVLHPRVAKQQYGGEPNLEQFAEFLKLSHNPVIYNGDLKTPDDICNIKEKFPKIEGVMLGRGLLGRPSLVNEYLEGKELPKEDRIIKMLDFHSQLFNHYSEVLCGDSQIISKIQPFWEYAEDEIGRKPWKAIKKASNIAKYQTAVASVQNSL